MAVYEWKFESIESSEVKKCAKQWNIPEICAAILYSRGARTKEEVDKFLKFEELTDPFDFTDMQKAVQFLKLAIDNNEKICVFGDYDADGITSTALIYLYFKDLGVDVEYYIPTREEGYGLNCSTIQKLHEKGIKIILTVDNGVSAAKEVEFAKSLGIRTVITDHHKLPEELPLAEAVVNPCRENWDLKYKSLAGVGVAYKLIQAFSGEKQVSRKYIDLVALGTIGDSMPLIGESRELLKLGLESICGSEIKGIKVLLEKAGINGKKADSLDLAFKVVPRINASGRIKTAEIALRLLISENEMECREICNTLDELNRYRKSIEREITQSIEDQIKENPNLKFQNVIVIKGKDWHHGILGIVASRLVQRYGKPCILISFSDDGEARGSCRSIEGISIYDLIVACSEHLERFGGHTSAAGISLKAENVDAFCEAIKEKAQTLTVDFPKIAVDAQITLGLISPMTLNFLKLLEPFGNSNSEPVFMIKNLKLKKIISLGKDGGHLKLSFQDSFRSFDFLYFNKNKQNFLYDENDVLDLLITLHPNLYRSSGGVSAHILDLKFSDLNIKRFTSHKKVYEKFKRESGCSLEEQELLLPSREEFAKVYRYLVLNQNRKLRVDNVGFKLFQNNAVYSRIYVILEVLEEMKLINVCWDADEFSVEIFESKTKVNLQDSKILSLLSKLSKEESYARQ